MTTRFEVMGIVTVTIIMSACFVYVGAHTAPDKEIELTADNSTVTMTNILKIQREKNAEEFQSLERVKGFKTLDDLTPETNGNPFRNVIVTTWRSGSTFLGEILNSMPANYHHFEPLVNHGITVIRGPPNDENAIYQVKQLLHCNYTNVNDYVNYGAKHRYVHSYNTRLWQYCDLHPSDHSNETEIEDHHPSADHYCSNANFLSSFCKLFPLQSMKLLRLRLALVESLLNDRSLNVRVVFLVRDPRAMMLSRRSTRWCAGARDCEHTATVCEDMVFDYHSAKSFQTKYPDRLKVVRYEELSMDPFKQTEEILKFYGLPFDRKVVEFLESHTKQNIGNIYSTYRNSSSTPFRWMHNLTYSEINDIQVACSKAMDLWGYKQMEKEDMNQSAEFKPLLQWTF